MWFESQFIMQLFDCDVYNCTYFFILYIVPFYLKDSPTPLGGLMHTQEKNPENLNKID